MTVDLVVVHYRTREPLARLFASLRAADPAPLGAVVVVNNSGEPIDDLIEAAGRPVRVITPGKNLGYAGGVNAGIHAADPGDVLVLNPDVRVFPGSIEALVRAAAAHPRAGILAPRLVFPDGTLQLSARRSYNWRTLLLRRIPLGRLTSRHPAVRDHLMADWDHADTRPVDWVIGAAMLVRREAMRDVGLMDERYFLYFEDVDWCERMRRHGWEVLYVAEARMEHGYARASAGGSPRSVRAHAAGLLRFTEKWSALVYAVSRSRRRVVQAAQLAADVAAAILACALAYGIRSLLDPWFEKPLAPMAIYAGLFFFTVLVTIAALAWNGLYRRLTFRDGIERAFLLAQAVGQAALLIMAATFLFQMPRYSRVLVLLVGPLLFLLLLAGRAALARAGAGARRQGFTFRRVLLLGSGGAMERARAALESARASGFEPLHAATPADGSETPEAAAARLAALVDAERIQIVCIVPEPAELPYLLALASSLRDSGAAVYWAGPLAHLVPAYGTRTLGPIDAALLHAPSRGLNVRARKRASDVFLSLLVAPWRWRGLMAHLASRGGGMNAGQAWRKVWSGERSWVGRTAYEEERWSGVPPWARLALESMRPGVVSPADPDGAPQDGGAASRDQRVESELAYLARFSIAEDLRIFLRATRLAAALAIFVGAAPDVAGAATTLFIRNHVNSNDVRDVTAWNGGIAAATTGGVVTAGMPAGPLRKILRSPGGLPSHRTTSVAASPSGALWIGTADRGIARLRADGRFARTLTSFEGLPSDRVQALVRAGDSIWVGTSGGAALFAEHPASGQALLRRSDTSLSTLGALVSDDVRAFARLGDTLWVGTGAGLSAFVSGAWIDRRDVFAGPVEALAAWNDTLWIGTTAGPRAWAGGSLAPVSPGHAGATLALHVSGGVLYSGTNGAGVYRRAGGAWSATGPGLPLGRVEALATAPDGALWAAAQTGLGRYDAAAGAWAALRTEGPVVDDLQQVDAAPSGGAWFTPGNTAAPGVGTGFVLHTDGTRWTALSSIGTGGSLQATSVFGVLVDRAGRVWLGHCCSPSPPLPRVERFDPTDSAWTYPGPANVIAFGEAPDGTIHGGSVEHGSGVYRFDPVSAAVIDSLTPLNTQGSASGSGLTSNNLRGIAFDAAGVGWFAHATQGLDRWDGQGTLDHADDAWARVTAGLPSQSLTSVAVLGDAVYVGTLSGAAVLIGGSAHLGRSSAINAAIQGAAVQDVEADPAGVVWIATTSGLARVDHAAGTVERFTTADGLVDDDVRGLAWDAAGGILWAATAAGVSEIRAQAGGAPAFDDGTFAYPNPLTPGAGALRLGGLSGAVRGEIRDVAGRRVRNFRADPVANSVWDLRDESGSAAAPGLYLVVIRDGARTRILRVAVTR